MSLNLAQAQLTRLRAVVDAKNQLRLCFDTVLQVWRKPLYPGVGEVPAVLHLLLV